MNDDEWTFQIRPNRPNSLPTKKMTSQLIFFRFPHVREYPTVIKISQCFKNKNEGSYQISPRNLLYLPCPDYSWLHPVPVSKNKTASCNNQNLSSKKWPNKATNISGREQNLSKPNPELTRRKVSASRSHWSVLSSSMHINTMMG